MGERSPPTFSDYANSEAYRAGREVDELKRRIADLEARIARLEAAQQSVRAVSTQHVGKFGIFT
jgi:hypothetical protein